MIDPCPPLGNGVDRFRMLFDRAAVGMCFVALDGRFREVNRRLGEIVGYSVDELLATSCILLTHPEDRIFEKQITTRMIVGEMSDATWEKRFLRKDGSIVWCNLTLTRVDDDFGTPHQFVGIVEDINERKTGAQKLAQNESLLRIAGETAHLGGWALDFTSATGVEAAELTWSDEACAIHEVAPGRIPSLRDAFSYYTPDSRQAIVAAVDECLRSGKAYDLELQIVTALGRPRWVRSIGQREPDSRRLVGAYQDITERKEAELEMIRMNRALKMLSGCNEVLIRATDETQLLRDICKLVVDNGGYVTAWVGFARDDERRSVEPVAFAGTGESYLANAVLSWRDDVPEGRGLAGETIRSGEAGVVREIATDPRFVPWRERALATGFRSVVALPLRDGERTFGVLALYAGEVASPPRAELDLLRELADDLAFGIGHIRAQAEKRRVHEAVLKISAAVSLGSSKTFFERLASNLADAIGAAGAFVARCDPTRPAHARTLAGVIDGVLVEPYEFELDGTPCGDLRSDRALVVADRLLERYPACSLARNAAAVSYVGKRLDDGAGAPLALIYVFFRKALENAAFVTSTLEIFAARAASELEREVADARIIDQASWLDRARDAIVVRGIDGRITFWNKSAERLYGWSSDIAMGADLAELLFEDSPRLREATADVLANGFWNGEIEQRCKDGSFVRVESRWTTMRDADGNPRSILSIDTDITQRKVAEREIENLAFFDPLTRLPNRLLFIQRMKSALDSCGSCGALLFIDLDNFKALNDTLGHDKGDLLLRHVAGRLQGCVRATDTVSRFGGDEFVIMLHGVGTTVAEATAHANRVASDVLASFNAPFVLDTYELNSTPSIGVTIFESGDSTDDLLKEADLAMYEAKASGRNAIRFFDPQMQAHATARRALEDDIRIALKRGEFALVYQPQVDVRGDVIGAEALVRWEHGRRGEISPAEFIPVAEESALIVPLGRWILRTACERLVAWAAEPALAKLKLSVNVSAREFRHPDFVRVVLEAVASTGADPRKLVLELTESVLVDDVDTVIAKMTSLRETGVTFSLDDFGTGYSSLSYLKRLPLRELKIDQSFVRDVLVDTNDAVIARTIVALAQSLSLDVIAEGVETQEQHRFLASHGCNSFQGYYFSRPLSARAFGAFVAARDPQARTGIAERISIT